MAHWHVSWVIDIEDEDLPDDAARRALEIQRNPDSIATCFEVRQADIADAPLYLVDLTEGTVVRD